MGQQGETNIYVNYFVRKIFQFPSCKLFVITNTATVITYLEHFLYNWHWSVLSLCYVKFQVMKNEEKLVLSNLFLLKKDEVAVC